MKRLELLLKADARALFLDRDGVINRRLPGDYVRSVTEFEFLQGVPRALHILSGIFHPVVVVTNQQGIGKGLMTEKELEAIHQHMVKEVEKAGGRIDRIFFSPDLKNTGSFTRKPGVGMGLAARKAFPGLKFRNSIMAGDSASDLLFGKRLGMFTVLINPDQSVTREAGELADLWFPGLMEFAEYCGRLK